MGMSAPSIDEERETRVMGTPPTVKVKIYNIYYYLNIYSNYCRNVCDPHIMVFFVLLKDTTTFVNNG
jgi:hypothetical protein